MLHVLPFTSSMSSTPHPSLTLLQPDWLLAISPKYQVCPCRKASVCAGPQPATPFFLIPSRLISFVQKWCYQKDAVWPPSVEHTQSSIFKPLTLLYFSKHLPLPKVFKH